MTASLLVLTAIIALLAGSASTRAGTHSLSTTHVGIVGNDGIFFDVSATGGVDLLIDQIDITSQPRMAATADFQIWTRPGSFVGFDTSADGWTIVGTYNDVTAGFSGIATVLGPLASNVTVPAGQTQAFFIVSTPDDAVFIVSDTGSGVVGTVTGSDSFLSIYDGTTAELPFTPAVVGRSPRVTVHYTLDAVGPHWVVQAKVGGGNILNPFLPDYEPGAWSQKNVVVYLACVAGDAPIDLVRRDQSTVFRDGIHTYSTRPTDVCIDENGLAAEPIIDWGPIMVDTVAPTCRVTPGTIYVPRNTAQVVSFGLELSDETSGILSASAGFAVTGGATVMSIQFTGAVIPTGIDVDLVMGSSTAGRAAGTVAIHDKAHNLTVCKPVARAK